MTAQNANQEATHLELTFPLDDLIAIDKSTKSFTVRVDRALLALEATDVRELILEDLRDRSNQRIGLMEFTRRCMGDDGTSETDKRVLARLIQRHVLRELT